MKGSIEMFSHLSDAGLGRTHESDRGRAKINDRSFSSQVKETLGGHAPESESASVSLTEQLSDNLQALLRHDDKFQRYFYLVQVRKLEIIRSCSLMIVYLI